MAEDSLSFFEEEREVPKEGLSNEPIPVDLTKEYHPTRERIVIEYLPEQADILAKRLGLPSINSLLYRYEELWK